MSEPTKRKQYYAKFDDSWLNKVEFKNWLHRLDFETAYCKICKTKFSVKCTFGVYIAHKYFKINSIKPAYDFFYVCKGLVFGFIAGTCYTVHGYQFWIGSFKRNTKMCAQVGKLWGKINNDEIEIRSLTRCDLEEALDVLDSFFLNESVCNGCEINLPENSQARLELRELCRLTAEDGISLVAKDVSNSKIVAVSFNKLQYIPDNNEDPFFIKFRNERCKSPQAQCLMDFMIAVDSETDVFDIYKIDCVCELMFLGTLPEYGRRGIACALSHYTIELTRELSKGNGVNDIHPQLRAKKPRAVTAIFTSKFSQKIGQELNFKILNSVSFDRFTYKGKLFTERINPLHTHSDHVIKLV